MDNQTFKQMDVLINNGFVLTMDAKSTYIKDGGVGVLNGKIAAIGSAADLKDCLANQIIDAKGKLIMPGLVNTHTHMPMSLFRGLADDLPLEKWLQEVIFPAEAKFINPRSVRLGTQLAVAEMLLNGITTCCDGYFFASVIADVISQTGMRAVLGQGVIDYPAPGVSDPEKNIDVATDFVRQWLKISPLLTPSVFCHAAYTCSPATLQAAKAVANDMGVMFQIHVAETRPEGQQCRQDHGCSPVAYLAQLGILDEKTLLVHAVWVDEADIEKMTQAQVRVVHCPESNMKLASGVSPVPKMIRQGIAVGLGTDGCASNNDMDLLAEMDVAAKIHKSHLLDPTVMKAQTVLRMATSDGARVLGLDHDIGSLEIGKQADLIMIDLDQPHLTPMYHPESHIVYIAKGTDVRDVMIAGQWVVRDRRLLSLDIDTIMADVRKMASAIADLRVGSTERC